LIYRQKRRENSALGTVVSFSSISERVCMMNADFWTDRAEAIELTIEGNRLIALELLELFRHLGRRFAAYAMPRRVAAR